MKIVKGKQVSPLLDCLNTRRENNGCFLKAFITSARQNWFEKHKEEMTNISDHPNENGYDSEVFIDKRTQASVKAMWVKTGQRRLAIQNLAYWSMFLVLLTLVAVSYSGLDHIDAYGYEQGIKEKLVLEEWDDFESKGLADVGNVEDWQMYLRNVFVPTMFSQSYVYHDSNGTLQSTTNTYRVNGQGKKLKTVCAGVELVKGKRKVATSLCAFCGSEGF